MKETIMKVMPDRFDDLIAMSLFIDLDQWIIYLHMLTGNIKKNL